ncbi:unnamed protein product [Didymodactylos carnosus]|uniref:Uncharacterized protein n=1 Tax=Didymodactylos carnosus TaxID=1234261 RepID=A0A814TE61_9BILA|nr:unnamed protein product [Didymodactylos carnosus]CAF1158319.1 unnamed protein product [Didymodactylos carnosus]CAF3579443.1 unnamed protein product [Didymodactylos carnosus]CAF3921704.1 unnamed protein product [Didymodactylos carnosus]
MREMKVFEAIHGVFHHQHNLWQARYDDIGHNKISLHGAKVIALMLEINRALLYLNISGNSLTDDGLVSIAKALKLNKSLIRLDIDECGFSDEGLSELSKVLTENSILTHLSMFRNEHITDDGINTLLNALEIKKTLLVVFISNTTISSIMKNKVRYILHSNIFHISK